MIPTIATHGEGNLFREDEIPFNLISDPIPATAHQAQPEPPAQQAQLFPSIPQEHASISARIPHGWKSETFESFGKTYKRAIDYEGYVWYWDGEWILNVPWFDSITNNPLPENIHGRKLGRVTKNGSLIIGNRRIDATRWNH